MSEILAPGCGTIISPDLDVRIYADASYGGENARSQSRVLMTIGRQPVGWYSRRQDVVAISITEAEYIADCKGAKDAAWIRQFLSKLKINSKPTLVTDSEGAYNLSKTNPGSYAAAAISNIGFTTSASRSG